MALATTMEKHWAIDGPSTLKKFDGAQEEVMINSIKGNIKKFKNFYLSENTAALKNNSNYVLESDEIINFQIPEFSMSYHVLDVKSYFTKAQKWIGHIFEITNNNFKAKLIDLTNPGTYEIGEFDLEEVSPEDKELLQIGATFYWSLGYANNNGQIKKESLLRFQRFSPWTATEFDNATDRANELNENLNWD